MSQPYPFGQYQPPPPPPAVVKPAGFAVSSLVLGIVGVVLSFVPLLNNITAAGAVVGFVLGFIGIWRSKAVMSGIGVVLCGLAVILTVVAQTQLADDLNELGDEFNRDMEQIEQDLSNIPTLPESASEDAYLAVVRYLPSAASVEGGDAGLLEIGELACGRLDLTGSITAAADSLAIGQNPVMAGDVLAYVSAASASLCPEIQVQP